MPIDEFIFQVRNLQQNPFAVILVLFLLYSNTCNM